MKSFLKSKPFAFGIFFGIVCIFLLAASGPIQHVIIDNTVLAGLTNATVTDANVTNAVAITNSWPTLITNITLTNYTGTDLVANDSLNTNGVEVANVVRKNGGSAVLLCASYISHTNLTTIAAIDMLVASQPITSWPTASAVAQVTNSELPYILGVVSFGTNGTTYIGREWSSFGYGMVCSQIGQNIGIKPATNSIFLYFKTRAAITNSGNDTIKLTIQQD